MGRPPGPPRLPPVCDRPIHVGPYAVVPTNGGADQVVIDANTPVGNRNESTPFFTILQRDYFLQLDPKTRIVVPCGSEGAGPLKALATYIEQFVHPCTDGDPTCVGINGAIDEYIDDAIAAAFHDDAEHVIATPREWLAHFRGLARAAGGMVDKKKLLHEMSRLLAQRLQVAEKQYAAVLKDEAPIFESDDHKIGRLLQLVRNWRLSTLTRYVRQVEDQREQVARRGLIRHID